MQSTAPMARTNTGLKWTDPAKLAKYLDQDWARASYGKSGGWDTPISPYVSLDLDRPMSVLDTSASIIAGSDTPNLNASRASELTGSRSMLQTNPSLTESGRDLTKTYPPLSTMSQTTMSIPSLPDPEPNTLNRIPQTEEQIGTNEATRTLRVCRSSGDLRTQALFRDSKFMFGFRDQH